MFIVEEQIVIEKPVAEVYRFLTEPANYPRWISDLKAVEAAGPFYPGETFKEVTVFKGKDKFGVGEILELVENDRVVMQIKKILSGPRLLPKRTFMVEVDGSGTLVRWRTEVKTGGMMRLFEPFLPKMFHQKKQQFLAKLKEVMELSPAKQPINLP